MKEAMKAAAGKLGGDSPQAAKADTAKKSSKPAKVKEIHIRRGHAGGYIVRNRVDSAQGDMGATQEHEYPMGKLAQVLKHVKQHMPAEASEAAMPGANADTPENC
jgi:hypothetical protein